ncbi:MAG: DNA-binding domain-containing protein [Burkholderiales bacterium]|nr:DNA-binding domain-containing protein [Burkholderiales bacterium]
MKALHEARRQSALLAAIGGRAAPLAIRELPARAARGLEAYRANAEALAERALGAVFATVQPMVGEENFKHLACEFWQAHPPQRGDVGEWGGEFPAWLETHGAMARWPWLGDCARLDLALHHNERAADAVFDAASLALLESTDPALLVMQLMPGTAVLRSRWPVATIHAAHRVDAAQSEAAFANVRSALDEERGEKILVVRQGWRAQAIVLAHADADWTDSLLAGANLSAALERAGEHFDFAAWLSTAVRGQWLKDVVVLRD